MKTYWGAIARALAIGCLLVPLRLPAMNGPEIMKMVDEVNRKAFSTAVVKTQLSTCKYEKSDSGIRCKDKPRVVVLEVGEKKYGGDNRDGKSIALVLEPISDKGVGMLRYEYYEANRDNENFLYLPALGKVRRLVSGSDNEDGGSFFGTEFYGDDAQARKIDEFTYVLLREETYDDRPTWVVEVTPTAARAKKTAYGKLVVWIDQERKIYLKEDIYNRSGRLYRQRLYRKYSLIDNVWLSRQQTMNNLSTNRITSIDNLSVTYHREVPDEVLTERSLTDFTFRERNLALLRTYYH
ncbi:outer membrane lipoprotein-sorting protein [Steroidobacter cummioxidans]|uniref:outer membrane lipoprotein-sorting protein n=1 Tax=Steroidobacter cummioxidans TaxID=1803913 RepID=UPI000E316326|nr:outer membrane lipoprotein-sorting protein [Steroidobacter cummioxidans]